LVIKARSYKVYAAWIGEKAARLKLNGSLLTPSPLSKLEELEMMRQTSQPDTPWKYRCTSVARCGAASTARRGLHRPTCPARDLLQRGWLPGTRLVQALQQIPGVVPVGLNRMPAGAVA
jgi:hypothetical protein